MEKRTSKHHIVPTSRGGDNNPRNITKVAVKKHRTYHDLFINRTPDEIIVYLVDYFWRGQIKWVRKALMTLERRRL